jgi:5-methylcytosine-specific restriction protein A
MPRAPRRCTRNGCDELAPCPHHTRPAWQGSTRRATLPHDWPAIVRRILRRDPSCQLAYPDSWHTAHGPTTCAGRSTEVDHIGNPGDHTPGNLRGVCSPCHRRRTQAQSAAARTH